jgi:hypothetical protein
MGCHGILNKRCPESIKPIMMHKFMLYSIHTRHIHKNNQNILSTIQTIANLVPMVPEFCLNKKDI